MASASDMLQCFSMIYQQVSHTLLSKLPYLVLKSMTLLSVLLRSKGCQITWVARLVLPAFKLRLQLKPAGKYGGRQGVKIA